MKPTRFILLGALLLSTIAGGYAFTDYAIAVASVNPGPNASGDPVLGLGAPIGVGLLFGSTDVYTLGVGGSVTYELDSSVVNAAGADLVVCENPFLVVGTVTSFVEAMFVEVSTNGTDFARFPTTYVGDDGPFAPTIGLPPAWYAGFAGVMPVFANPLTGFDPLDVVAGGGDAFDLAELLDHPLVLDEKIDLDEINYVRLVDVASGVEMDSFGTLVWDAGLDSLASADIDAIVAVNSQANQVGGRPRVEMTLDNGWLTIEIEDDNGLNDIKAGLKASVNGLPLPFFTMLPYFFITELTDDRLVLFTGPIPSGQFGAVLKVGAVDGLGLAGGDAVVIQ
ncbi:MAG: hypothetical protein ACYTCU_06630 [Planctomycetota bacterium]|jgi:hypothetical protein